MNFEVQLDTYRAPDGTCVAPECSNVWDILQQSRAEAEVPNIPDYCQRWQQFVCGSYYPPRQGNDHHPVATDSIVHALFDTLHMMMDPSHKNVIVKPSLANHSNDTRYLNGTGYSKSDVALLESLEYDGGNSTNTRGKVPHALYRNGTLNGTIPNFANSTIHLHSWNNFTHERDWIPGPPYGNDTFLAAFPYPRPPTSPNSTQAKSSETNALWDKAARYYNSCIKSGIDSKRLGESVLLDLMEEVNSAFAPLDKQFVSLHGDRLNTYRPRMDTTKPITEKDMQMVTKAMINLGKYGIFPLFRFGAAVSYHDPNEIRPIVAPPYRTGLRDPNLYKFGIILKDYERQIEVILPKLYGSRFASIQGLYNIPRKIIALEKRLQKVMPKDGDWRNMKYDIQSTTPDKLQESDPYNAFSQILPAMMKGHAGNTTMVDVVLPKAIKAFWKAMLQKDKDDQVMSKETLRAFMLWQTFLQTVDLHLWDFEWVRDWREFSVTHLMTYKPVPRHDEVCMVRVQRHFHHVTSNTLLANTFPQQNNLKPVFTIGHQHVRLGYPTGCPYTITDTNLHDMYKDVDVHSGKPDTAPWENDAPVRVASLSRPQKWSHLHDWFALEKMHWQRTWADIGVAEDKKCLHFGVSFKNP